MSKVKMPIGHIVIYEDWNQDNDGCVWYRWRREGEKHWHVKLTPLKQKPIVSYKYISPFEYEQLLAPPEAEREP